MWYAKNDPNWEKYMNDFENLGPDPDGPDPEEHALSSGDLEALHNMFSSWFTILAEMDHRTNILMREISHLSVALENLRAAGNTATSSPQDNGEGSFRFPSSPQDPSDLPPTQE